MAARSIRFLSLMTIMGLLVPGVARAGHGDAHKGCLGEPATILGTSGDDQLLGTAGHDVIVALSGDDTILGLAGDDYVCAGRGDDELDGDAGDDFLFGFVGDDQVLAGSDDDHAYGGVGIDVVLGEAGDDLVRGGRESAFGHHLGTADTVKIATQLEEADLTSGGAGDDVLLDGYGVDEFDGGPGNDSLGYGASVSLVDLGQGVAVSEGDVVDSVDEIENVLGFVHYVGTGRDRGADPVLRGDDNDNILIGGSGPNHIFGGAGNDLLDGFYDLDDELDGGPGLDIASFRFQSNGVNADLTAGRATGMSSRSARRTLLIGLEALAGGPDDDLLRGDGVDNYLFGFYGDDNLEGLAGDDVLDGGSTWDRDRADGGEGTDRCVRATYSSGCEFSSGEGGPRRTEAVDLIRRVEDILDFVIR